MSGKVAKATRRHLRRALQPVMEHALDEHTMAIRDLLRRIKDIEMEMIELRRTLDRATMTASAL